MTDILKRRDEITQKLFADVVGIHPVIRLQMAFNKGFTDGAVKGLVEALEEILEQHGSECRFDHNKNCQEHLCFAYDGSCHIADAKADLANYHQCLKELEG
jgi:hypothetical protein